MAYDGVIPAFSSIGVVGTETLLPMHDGQGLHHATLWDDEHHVLLAATGEMSFISAIVMNMHVLDPEPRVFSVPDGHGGEKTIRFGLTPKPIKNVVGEPKRNPAGEWTQRRLYQEETDRLRAERRFVQYKPEAGQQLHEKALDDLRFLINRHGEEGAWLWDPYLSAEDVINTLFHCRFFGAKLRALTAGYIPPGEDQPALDASVPASANFAAEQRAMLTGLRSNLRGLNLEFRIRTGSVAGDSMIVS
jgi:hypothetical protein